MICHTTQNGGFLILCLCIIITKTLEHIVTVGEFCSEQKYINHIEPGKPYVLTLKNEQNPEGANKWHEKFKRECRQEFQISDTSAHFEISVTNMSIPSCSNCRCSYFEISASGYNKRFCGNADAFFKSKINVLSILIHPALMMSFDVTFTFTAQRNFYVITGISSDSSAGSFIETPYFPAPCPSNYRAEYLLQSDTNIHVMLLFLDFQISHQSFIEVLGNNGTHKSRFYGNIFRPPVFVSQSNELYLKFESNDQSGMTGFRAEFSFLQSIDHPFVPYTDCGGLEGGQDGHLYIKTHERFGLYDCLWNIKSFTFLSKLYLSVFINLRDVGHKSNMEIRKGLNSKDVIVTNINCEKENCLNFDTEIVVSALEPLYIRFHGYLDEHSVVNMTYSTFHKGNCSNELKCNDGRCLLSHFRCDGIKQCPNGTDEDDCPSSEIVEDEVLSPSDKTQEGFLRETIAQKFIILVVVGSCGLVTVLVVCLISRCKYVTAERPQQACGMQTIVCPINCDNPPSYEDFIKASDNYPPILYTRANQSFVPNANSAQCTTSFCRGPRVRHYSVDAGSDVFLNITENSHISQPPLISNRYNIEINRNLSLKESKKTIRRSYSVDSKLNDLVNKDFCNIFLSIIHPACGSHSPHVQCNTLPSNFKMNAFKTRCSHAQKMNQSACLQHDLAVNSVRDRCFTWSFVPPKSVGSEIVTIVKTRCFSDPCTNGISVHCSLY